VIVMNTLSKELKKCHSISVSHVQGMPNYGASPGYPGAPHHYSSTGQYHPYGASSQSHMPGSGHMSMIQQQQALAAGHRFNPSVSSSSTAGRSEVGNSGMAEGSSSYMVCGSTLKRVVLS